MGREEGSTRNLIAAFLSNKIDNTNELVAARVVAK